jgi:hypothetical protein
MKSIILLLAMVGILMVGMGFIQNNMQCPPSHRHCDFGVF